MKQRSRQPVGSPDGGEFAAEQRGSAGITLVQKDHRIRLMPGASAGTLIDENGREVELNQAIDFDEPFRVNADGSVDLGVYTPAANQLVTISENTDADTIESVPEALRGHTSQHGYNGPVMHPSEQLAGGMARSVLEQPGTYIVSSVESYNEDDNEYDDTPAGWATYFIPEGEGPK